MTMRQIFLRLSLWTLGGVLVTVLISGTLLTLFSDSLLLTFFSKDPIGGARFIILVQTIVLLIASLTGAFISLTIIKRRVVEPLQSVIIAMAAFAEKNELSSVSLPPDAPSEVQTLAGIFSALGSRVEATHAKDVEVSRVKSDFISTAAHQLRTPLTGIRWALEALQKEKLTAEQQMFLTSAVDKSHDLVAVVGTLLDISSIESGKYKYDFKECDLQRLASEVTNDFMPLANQSNVTLTYNVGEGQLPSITADRDRIKWVLNNLIENAVRYTPVGGTVQVSTEAIPGRIQVKVRDTGIGITAGDKNNIFERFYRAGNAITKENKGSGLGLYIARTIATDHKGDLNFTANASGPGTTFTLSLPTTAP